MSAVLNPTRTRDALMPREPRGLGLGLVLALLAHGLLIAALAFGVNWHAHETQGIEAELWAAVPQAAAPRAVAPEPTPPTPPAPAAKPEPRPPEPVQKVEPARPDPQIAIEQAKRDEARRKQAQDEQRERDKANREAAEQDRQRAEQLERKKRDAEKDRAEAARLAAAREANLKRMMGQAGATGDPTDTGTAARSSGPSAGYAGRIMAQIKRNILFNDVISSNPVASVEVRLAPDGTIVSRRLLKSSGNSAWDDAVLRAIDKTAILPRDIDGRVPPVIQIESRPNE